MALIEGVGDEVTLLFGVLLLLVVLLLAWASTQTPQHLLPVPPMPPPPLVEHQAPPATVNPSSSSSEAPPPGPGPTEDSVAPPADQEHKEEEGGEVGGAALGADGLRHRETAGGASGGPESNMVLRLKFLNDTERTAAVQPDHTVGHLKRTYFPGEEQQVRLIYQGRLLQDDSRTLSSLQLAHNSVLHCYVSQHPVGGPAGGARPADQVAVALNVGSLMVPLFLLMLVALWYCQIRYRHAFTAPATASLVGVTVFFSLVAFGVYRR